MEIIAHRGSSFLAPENTLAAFRLGWEETTICELDIRPTGDGKLAVIHDASTRRTTGIDFVVAEHSLSELQRLDAGSWKGAEWKGEKLSSLEEVIAAMPTDKRLFIEIKERLGVVPELQRVIRASGKEKQLLLQSFSYTTCTEVKEVFPLIPVYLLIASERDRSGQEWLPSIDEMISKAKNSGLDGINVENAAFLTGSVVKEVRATGLKVGVWTVDDPGDARRLMESGIEALTTNRPGWMKAQLVAHGACF